MAIVARLERLDANADELRQLGEALDALEGEAAAPTQVLTSPTPDT